MAVPRLALFLTRPEAASRRFYAALPAHLQAVLIPVYAPLIAIETIDQPVDTSLYKGIIFTSSNGVLAAGKLGVSPAQPAYCVGARTGETARAGGWQAQVSGQSANELVEALIAAPPAPPLLHLRGVHSRGQVSSRLSAAGLTCDERVIYDQRSLPLDPGALEAIADTVTIAPVFSPRTAEQFSHQYAGSDTLFLAALSGAVADSLRGMKCARLAVAPHPSADAMRELIGKLVNEASRVEAGGGPQ